MTSFGGHTLGMTPAMLPEAVSMTHISRATGSISIDCTGAGWRCVCRRAPGWRRHVVGGVRSAGHVCLKVGTARTTTGRGRATAARPRRTQAY
eukprot:6058435-Prymnesium_polylepis.1